MTLSAFKQSIMIKKIVLKQSIPIFTILFFSLCVRGQEMKSSENSYKTELENEIWITDKILGLNDKVKKYTLTKYTQRKFAGNLTAFSNKESYTSQYVAPCGNDYFTTVVGKCKFIDKNKIAISVDSVTYHGEWNKPTEYRKSKELIFSISKSDHTIIFTKLND